MIRISAVILLVAATASAAELFTAWVPPAQRTAVKNLDIRFRDHDGRAGLLRELVDRPAVVTFFYTRCQNAKKCSAVVSRLGALQRELQRIGAGDQIRLIAISYEPQFDTPERLSRFASNRGLRLNDHSLALQLDSKRHQELVDELQAPANYNAGWINTHGVELTLLDRGGRVVRKYHTVGWDTIQVMRDLQELLKER